MNDQIKTMFDIAAGSVALATILKWLPAIAAAFTIVWTAMRMYDWIKEKWKK